MFWDPDVLAGSLALDALACPGRGDTVDFGRLDVTLITCRRADGRRLVELRQGSDSVVFEIAAGELLGGPVLPRYRLTGVLRLPAQLATLARIDALCRHGRLPAARPCSPRAARWAAGLCAYDGVAAGASQREVATALFGRAVADRDWCVGSDYLRSRVRRLVRESERLVEGGYRDLLGPRM